MQGRIHRFAILCLFLASCYKDHLYVQQEWVDRDFLASTHVGTPDPRQTHPPEGQRLLIAWDFPRSWLQKELLLVATVRFWDNSEQVFSTNIEKRRDYTALFFPEEKSGKILTYLVEVFDAQGDVVETWKHHFWTQLIDIDKSSSSVSSQPKQGSLTETP